MTEGKTQVPETVNDKKLPAAITESQGDDYHYVAIRQINLTVRYQTVTIPSGSVISDQHLIKVIKECFGASAPIRRVSTKDLIASGRI